MSTDDVFHALLRPAVVHILRASGFIGAKPSVVDTVTDLTARYLTLIASRTAYNAYSNHNDLTPDLSDVRMAMQDCGLLVPTMTAGEELWKQILRKPLEEYLNPNVREKEEQRRNDEDTADVKAFIDWAQGEQNKDIRRIAGVLKQPQPPSSVAEQLDALELEDYLSSLMKKHSKTGVDSRYQGTILGKPGETKPIKIEGGAVDSIEEWCRKTRERAGKVAGPSRDNQDLANHVDDVIETREESEDLDMDTQ